MLAELGIRFGNELIQHSFCLMIFARRKQGREEKIVQSQTMNNRLVRMFVTAMGLMIVSMRRNWRAFLRVGRQRRSLAVRPCRSCTGENHEQTASYNTQTFHCED